MATINCLVPNIFQYMCSTEEMHAGLEQEEGE